MGFLQAARGGRGQARLPGFGGQACGAAGWARSDSPHIVGACKGAGLSAEALPACYFFLWRFRRIRLFLLPTLRRRLGLATHSPPLRLIQKKTPAALPIAFY